MSNENETKTIEVSDEKLKLAVRVLGAALEEAKIDSLTGIIAMKMLIKTTEEQEGIIVGERLP